MKSVMPRRLCASLFGLTALLATSLAVAQTQTQVNRPIRVIVPYVPGGGTDLLARLLGPYIGDEFGQSFVIENRPGGGSTIGTVAVAKAAPDGTTLGMIDLAFVTNPSLVAKLPYDTLTDFAPVAFVATSPLVLLIHPNVPATTVKELVAYAKANPAKLSFGSAGLGTGVHLAGEQFKTQAGLDIVHVPYKGTTQAVGDLVGGQITMLFTTLVSAKSMVDTGRLRALAIASPKRSSVMPTVPTFAESGLPGVDAGTINGLIAPAGTPPDYIQRVNTVVNRALKNPAVLAKLNEQGFAIPGGTPLDFSEWIHTEIPKWAKVVKDAGLKVE